MELAWELVRRKVAIQCWIPPIVSAEFSSGTDDNRRLTPHLGERIRCNRNENFSAVGFRGVPERY